MNPENELVGLPTDEAELERDGACDELAAIDDDDDAEGPLEELGAADEGACIEV